MQFWLIASLIVRVHRKVRSLSKSNQLQNNRIIYEFNQDLHNLLLMRGMISRGSLRWKLEMHMTFDNRERVAALDIFIQTMFTNSVGLRTFIGLEATGRTL